MFRAVSRENGAGKGLSSCPCDLVSHTLSPSRRRRVASSHAETASYKAFDASSTNVSPAGSTTASRLRRLLCINASTSDSGRCGAGGGSSKTSGGDHVRGPDSRSAIQASAPAPSANSRVQVQGPERAGHPRYQPLPYKARGRTASGSLQQPTARRTRHCRPSGSGGVVGTGHEADGTAKRRRAPDARGSLLQAGNEPPEGNPQNAQKKPKPATSTIPWIWLADGLGAHADPKGSIVDRGGDMRAGTFGTRKKSISRKRCGGSLCFYDGARADGSRTKKKPEKGRAAGPEWRICANVWARTRTPPVERGSCAPSPSGSRRSGLAWRLWGPRGERRWLQTKQRRQRLRKRSQRCRPRLQRRVRKRALGMNDDEGDEGDDEEDASEDASEEDSEGDESDTPIFTHALPRAAPPSPRVLEHRTTGVMPLAPHPFFNRHKIRYRHGRVAWPALAARSKSPVASAPLSPESAAVLRLQSRRYREIDSRVFWGGGSAAIAWLRRDPATPSGTHTPAAYASWVTLGAVFTGSKLLPDQHKPSRCTPNFPPSASFLAGSAHDERGPDRRRVLWHRIAAYWEVEIRRFFAARRLHAYQDEAAGDVYLHANVKIKHVHRWSAGLMHDNEFTRRIALKAGHTKCLPRRLLQYRKCDRGQRVIIWLGLYRVARRCFVERLIHLRVFQHGGRRFGFRCACRVRHREYVTLSSVGGFGAFRAHVSDVLAEAGEVEQYKCFRRPALYNNPRAGECRPHDHRVTPTHRPHPYPARRLSSRGVKCPPAGGARVVSWSVVELPRRGSTKSSSSVIGESLPGPKSGLIEPAPTYPSGLEDPPRVYAAASGLRERCSRYDEEGVRSRYRRTGKGGVGVGSIGGSGNERMMSVGNRRGTQGDGNGWKEKKKRSRGRRGTDSTIVQREALSLRPAQYGERFGSRKVVSWQIRVDNNGAKGLFLHNVEYDLEAREHLEEHPTRKNGGPERTIAEDEGTPHSARGERAKPLPSTMSRTTLNSASRSTPPKTPTTTKGAQRTMRTTSSMHLPEGQAPWKAVVQNEQKKIRRWRGRDSPMTLSALGACARSERRTKEYKKGARRMKSRRRGIGATLKAKRLASTKLPKRNSLGVANPRYTREATIEEEREEKSIQEKKLTPNPSQRNRKQTLPRAQPFVPPRGHHFFLVVVFAVSEKGEEALVIWKGKREAEGGRREGEGRGERGREGAGRERGGGKGVGGGEGGGERTIRLKGRKGDSNETTRRKEERKTRQSRAGEVKGNAASIAAEGDMSGNNEDEVKRKADHIATKVRWRKKGGRQRAQSTERERGTNKKRVALRRPDADAEEVDVELEACARRRMAGGRRRATWIGRVARAID
ncbi:hypothetical protein DFH06DRAFT_1143533 [Mycena polygramma]|nr:hypothetical protein DFH06DRAFT_1143533 [Mycena polygramma]